MRPVVARDIPVDALDLNTYYTSLAATPKHVMGNCFSPHTVREVVRLASLIAGGEAALRERPFVSWTNCWTVSPLRYAPETVETLDEIVRDGFRVLDQRISLPPLRKLWLAATCHLRSSTSCSSSPPRWRARCVTSA